MGSIYCINPRPKTWCAFDSGRYLKPEFGGEPLMVVRYGIVDDDPDGTVELEMFMRKSIYDKLIAGGYRVDEAASHNQRKIVIVDSNGDIVERVANGFCY